jgi:hypothetical protein
MFTNTKFVLSVAIMLGTACAVQAAAGLDRSASNTNQRLWKR